MTRTRTSSRCCAVNDARRLAAIKKIQEYAGEPIAATAATPATDSLRRPLRLLRWFAFGKRIRARGARGELRSLRVLLFIVD